MESWETDGQFWIAGKPDRKVAGRLVFDEVDGLQLDLIGSLHDPLDVLASQSGNDVRLSLDELFGANPNAARILGETLKGHLTLANCYRDTATFSLFGPRANSREHYTSTSAFLGDYIEQQPIEITAVRTGISNLEAWIAKPSTVIELDYKADNGEFAQVRIVNTPTDPITTSTDLGELELSFDYRLGGDHIIQSRIEQNCLIECRFPNPEPLENALRICSALQHLVTIGVGAPSSIETISLSHTDISVPTKFYAPLLGPNSTGKVKTPHPQQMLFTFDGMGGLTKVGSWLGVADKYHTVIGLLTSNWYRPEYYAEDRFFHCVTAAETLARIRKQSQRVNLKAELESLGNDVALSFQPLVGDIKQWAKRIRDVRVGNVIHRGLRDFERPPLFLLSESLYYLLVLWLLRESGVPAKTLANIGRHQRFLMVAEQLQGEQ